MLVSLDSVLDSAREQKTAVGAFNVYNLESILAVVEAAKKFHSPAIISFGEGYFKHAPIETIAAIVSQQCSTIDTPVVLHLDHAKKFSSIIKAIKCGFTSVMYDGSGLSIKENMENTRRIVEIAHEVGVSVEGEIGYMNDEFGEEDSGMDMSKGYTRPEEAYSFAEYTGVDALAIAIGNAHGVYRGIPRLDFDRLTGIRSSTGVPLVLHGCSGISPDDIKIAVSLGICKINVNTEISLSAVNEVRQMLDEEKNPNLRFEKIMHKAKERMIDSIEKYISLLTAV